MTDRGGGASLLPYTSVGVTGSDDDDDDDDDGDDDDDESHPQWLESTENDQVQHRV